MLQHLLLLNFIYTEYYINAAGNMNVFRVVAVFGICQLVDGQIAWSTKRLTQYIYLPDNVMYCDNQIMLLIVRLIV